ncbi:MAG: PQQ-dependent sugar dehydrogenase [Psychromonas sp.]
MHKLLSLILCLITVNVYAQNNYHLQKIASGLTHPWGLQLIDDGNMLITERTGAIKKLDLNSGDIFLIAEIGNVVTSGIATSGQGGLLDIAQSPVDKSTFYFTYSKNTTQGAATTLAKANIENTTLSQWQDLLISDSATSTSRHYGSRIAFDNKGHLFFSIGDRGVRDNAQNLANHAGSILRLNLDGTIPKDNPFVSNSEVANEIWSFGHRNPQGLYFDQQTEQLWAIEHGPRGGDEINLIIAKANYGWPITSHGKEYSSPFAVGEAKEKTGIVSPIKVYIPSIAPSSLILYRGDEFPALNGKLLAGALKLTHINIISIKDKKAISEQRIFADLSLRIRDIEVDSQGVIYFCSDNGDIYRIANKD